MSEPPGDSPHIRIASGADGVVITQHRPAVLSALDGITLERALELVPRLLPICGIAQSIAASRAAEAARGEPPRAEREHARNRHLLREQALTAGWRLAVDWPDLLGKARQMDWLKALRSRGEAGEIAALLDDALPGLASVATLDDLRNWAREGASTAADTVRHALDIDAITTSAPLRAERLRDADLADTARSTLAAEAFDALAPVDRPLEVGPLAMARDPLIHEFGTAADASCAARIMALVLDTRSIARGLRGEEAPSGMDPDAWSEGGAAGTGRAITARGPVFHRVELDKVGTVARWRAVAPTDWHFAPCGAVARALDHSMSLEEAKLVVSSFDPCAPWELERDEEP